MYSTLCFSTFYLGPRGGLGVGGVEVGEELMFLGDDEELRVLLGLCGQRSKIGDCVALVIGD